MPTSNNPRHKKSSGVSGTEAAETGMQTQLRAWFKKHKRNLPWRREPRAPYHVWLSEVMLQQTQVATVIPYFERWLRRFPTLRAFAEAPLDDVLKLWEGLGYYSRARNFHKAAQTVMREHAGTIPGTVEALLTLPGVGRYTAGAIASLAFGAHAAVLDGNVKRVFARLRAIDDPALDLWPLAEALLPRNHAGEFNEALMELGATVCKPRNPDCARCPIRSHCAGFATGTPEQYPIKVQKARTPHYDVLTAIIINPQGEMLLGQRAPSGLLGGLWEFVSSDFRGAMPLMAAEDDVRAMTRERAGIDVTPRERIGLVKHAFTHFKITRHVWLCVASVKNTPASAGYAALRWVSRADIAELALTRSDLRIAALTTRAL